FLTRLNDQSYASFYLFLYDQTYKSHLLHKNKGVRHINPLHLLCRVYFSSSSCFSSSIKPFVAFLNSRKELPAALPISGSFDGPNINKATIKINIRPGIPICNGFISFHLFVSIIYENHLKCTIILKIH